MRSTFLNTIKTSPLAISALVHFGIVFTIFIIQVNFFSLFKTQTIPFEVMIEKKTVDAKMQLQPPKPKVEDIPKPAEPAQRKVFGLTRKAITTDSATEKTAVVKLGNTVAKEEDNLKLEKNDADSLPIPVEDYLVTTQPKRLHEEKVERTKEAMNAGIEAPVVVDILIDETGKVRDVEVIQGPGYGLNEAVKQAMYKFLYTPALVNGKPVAKKFRYMYRFNLE
ncbi:MAG: TonB family protein [Pseudobdellovibrio sp.]